MHTLTALLSSLIFGAGIVPAFAQPAAEATKVLQGLDNAPNMDKGRPVTFEAGKASGYVLVSFARARQ